MLRGEVIGDVDRLVDLSSGWDSLAVACGRPYCLAAWMLSWWRHVAPDGAQLRSIAVTDGDDLIGIAPFFVLAGGRGLMRYRLLAAGTSTPTMPIASPGRERDVAAVIVDKLREARPLPHAISFEGNPAASSWGRLLVDVWPGVQRPWINREVEMSAPVLSLQGRTYEEWFSSKSSNFRQQMRRGRRQLERSRATFRLAETEHELEAGLRFLFALHYQRWETRGGSVGVNARVERMLRDAGRQLLRDGRFLLWSIEVDGAAISSLIFLRAGGEVTYWNGGFDEAWAAQRPSLQLILAAIEHAWSSGDNRVNLGGGGQPYKYRFADAEEPLEWISVIPVGSRHRLTRLQLAPVRLRRAVVRKLPAASRARLRKVLRR